MPTQLVRVISQPGVQRDGTVMASLAYTNAQWCRWQRQLPRKMGGYTVTQPYLTAVSRALISQANSGFRFVYSGNQAGVDAFTTDNTGVSSTVISPQLTIPATTNPTTAGLVVNPANTWQFDTQFDNASGIPLLFAFCSTNLLDPSSSSNFPLYATSVYSPNSWNFVAPDSGSTPVAKTGFIQVPGFGTGSDGHGNIQQALFPNGISGGIVSLEPYLIVYGNNGFFAWSAPGFPTDFRGVSQGNLFVGATQITDQKVIRGLPLRGGGGFSPSGLFWSVDALTRATFIGVSNGTWQFDQITKQSSILSDRSVIENDGTFYWAGMDRFLMFNGIMREIPNSMNINWMFDNINPANASKSFIMKIPRYGELWYCYPRGTNTECSHAVIFNWRENSWYDTALPNFGRSSGLHTDNLVGPLMGGVLPYVSSVSGTPTTYLNLWEHEAGKDEINGHNQTSVLSSFTTAPITGLDADPPSSAGVSVGIMMPDLLQTGDMTVQVLKQNNPQQPQYPGTLATIQATPATEDGTVTAQNINNVVFLKDTAKIIQLQFTSNTLGGDYQMGRTMLEITGDGKRDT